MSNVYVATAVPKNLEWWGIGPERAATTPFIGAPGTLAAPTVTIPLTTGDPTDSLSPLVDHALRGDMGEDYNEVFGTRIGNFPLDGNVYLDSIGHLLYNTFGDYTATGASASGLTGGTVAAGIAQGVVTAFTIAGATGSVVGSAPFYLQVGQGTTADPYEVIVCSALTLTTATPSSPGCRFTHPANTHVLQVQAPFVHTFALLNGGATAIGLPANAQPITHTVTHNNALPANATFNSTYLGQRRYGYWCSSGMDFTMNLNNLFQHSTKGTSFFGVDHTTADSPATPFTNSQTDAGAQPVWRFQVGLGGPASGGTLVNNIESSAVSIARGLTNKFAQANQQDPVIIGRLGLTATGKLTFIAQDEAPLYQMIAGQTMQVQLAMTNGLSGANLQGVTFNYSRAFFEAATLSDPDMMTWDVPFRGLMNATDTGASGARGPMTVALTNAVPTY